MRWASVAVAMGLSLGVVGTVGGGSALAAEGEGTGAPRDFSLGVGASEDDLNVFATSNLRPMELVAPVGMEEIDERVAAPLWVTPMAPLPPPVLVGASGMVLAGWWGRRVR